MIPPFPAVDVTLRNAGVGPIEGCWVSGWRKCEARGHVEVFQAFGYALKRFRPMDDDSRRISAGCSLAHHLAP